MNTAQSSFKDTPSLFILTLRKIEINTKTVQISLWKQINDQKLSEDCFEPVMVHKLSIVNVNNFVGNMPKANFAWKPT